jgi:hypothetical protein
MALKIPGVPALQPSQWFWSMVFPTRNPGLIPVINAGLQFIKVLTGSIAAIVIARVWSFLAGKGAGGSDILVRQILHIPVVTGCKVISGYHNNENIQKNYKYARV